MKVWQLRIETKDGEFFDYILFKSYKAMMKYWSLNDEAYKGLGLVIRGGGGEPVFRKAFKLDEKEHTRFRAKFLLK